MEIDLTVNSSDINVLRKQLEESPMLFWFYANQLEGFKSEVSAIKLRLDILESSISSAIRKEQDKVSEAKIGRMLFEVPEYIELTTKLNEAIERSGRAEALVKAIERRHSILITVASIIKQEMKQLL